jgi:protein-serine/threonine kinase
MKSPTEKHHHLKNIFRKETTPISGESSSSTPPSPSGGSHTGLSKLFHHNSSAFGSDSSKFHQENGTGTVSRTSSILSLKRHNSLQSNSRARSTSDSRQMIKEPKKLSKAETLAHLQAINTKNSKMVQNRPQTPLASTPSAHGDKIVYNPYGLNKNPTQELPKNTSFYLSGTNDGERVLANPVRNPNDFLPEDMQQEHVNLLEDYEIDVGSKKLGDGGSSDVRIINAKNHKKECYALKRFILLSKETDEEFYDRVSKEFIISKKLSKSRHVLDTLTLVRIQSQQNLSRGWGLVLEFCSGGDLFGNIVKPGWRRFPIAEKFCLWKQVCYGVKFLHDLDIVHRDLKPENVLLDANGVAKLCDFGVSEYGHEVPHDFTSPIKTHTAYIGSPPYSPPEVMLLKEKSHAEAKGFAYDPFKMDCWGLGMLLFCMIYSNVPFQLASPTDHGYRDYKFSHNRFCSDHPGFRVNNDFTKGPGLEFKWAAQFQSTGASRVAWKLCDPSPNNRYTLETLFKDPWFTSLEMCIYEHPDQNVNPFVLPGTGNNVNGSSTAQSTSTSAPNSQAPSRRATLKNEHPFALEDGDGLSSPFRSMLDLVDVAAAVQLHHDDSHDSSSIHSQSSLTHSPVNFKKDHPDPTKSHGSYESDISSVGTGEFPKVKSMLNALNEKDNLPAVQETEPLATHPDLPVVAEREKETSSELEGNCNIAQSDEACDVYSPAEDKDSEDAKKKSLPDLNKHTFYNSSDLKLDTSGMCELGYRIKKHHHMEISTVAVSGSMSRRR